MSVEQDCLRLGDRQTGVGEDRTQRETDRRLQTGVGEDRTQRETDRRTITDGCG